MLLMVQMLHALMVFGMGSSVLRRLLDIEPLLEIDDALQSGPACSSHFLSIHDLDVFDELVIEILLEVIEFLHYFLASGHAVEDALVELNLFVVYLDLSQIQQKLLVLHCCKELYNFFLLINIDWRGDGEK